MTYEKQKQMEAKLRKEFQRLSPEAQEDDFVGLHLDLADVRLELASVERELRELKARDAELLADDRQEVIRRLQASLKNADSQKWRANEKANAALRQVYALKKRVKELEAMEIPLD